jgi:hypothetical protein
MHPITQILFFDSSFCQVFGFFCIDFFCDLIGSGEFYTYLGIDGASPTRLDPDEATNKDLLVLGGPSAICFDPSSPGALLVACDRQKAIFRCTPDGTRTKNLYNLIILSF